MTREPAPRTLVLTLFVGADDFSARDYESGRAQRRVARLLALRLLRDSRLGREARRSRGFRIRRISLMPGRSGRFDHVVGRLRLPGARSHVARLDAEFHLGTLPTGSATVTLRLGARRPKDPHHAPS